MGLFRKLTSVSTLGAVDYRSRKDERAAAERRTSKAARKSAKADSKRAAAEARLLDAQADAVRRQGGEPMA